jgi:hypothetical protein
LDTDAGTRVGPNGWLPRGTIVLLTAASRLTDRLTSRLRLVVVVVRDTPKGGHPGRW